jgi:hypothetical protein
LTSHIQRIVDLVAKSKKPAIYVQPEYAEAGGLMAYNENRDSFLSDVAGLVDRILRSSSIERRRVRWASRLHLASCCKRTRLSTDRVTHDSNTWA